LRAAPVQDKACGIRNFVVAQSVTELLEFSDSGGEEDTRSIVFDDIDVETSAALVEGKPITHWNAGVRVRQRSKGTLEDVPWSMPGGAPIVSDRVRAVFEREAPGQVQFVPLAITRRGKPIDGPQYWIMNLLHVVDCFDRKRSGYSTEVEDGVLKYFFEFNGLVLNCGRVPSHVKVFRVEHFEETMVMRAEPRQALDADAITGMQYRDIRQV
jgi:hypothetical protein